MTTEIISIGTELLLGSILNTNARFLSQQLAHNAVDVYHQVTIGDNIPRIIEALQKAADRSDLIITSGGLGPTEDDVTARAVGEFLGKPLIFHKPTYQYIQDRLKKRSLPMNKLVARQCYIQKDALVFKNLTGTAPGTLSMLERNGRQKWLLVLPGPPRELEPMFRKAFPALLRLAKIKPEAFEVRTIKISGLLESQVAQKVTDLLRLKPPLTVGIYARPNEVELKIMAKAPFKTKAMAMAEKIEKIIRKRLRKNIFGINEETLSSVLGKLLIKKNATLAVAESCTGGLLSHLLTETSGSSDYFKGSVVAYHNQIKSSAVQIPPSLLAQHGAVSASAAKAMAQNIRLLFKTTYGVGITGIAGPTGGSKKKPVGLVYIATAGPKKTLVKKFIFLGNRSEIKLSAATAALDLLRYQLL